jgi:hypothetical protein
MLVPPMPAMMPSIIFSSKVLSSSSSSSAARAAPAAITRPMPSTATASFSPRQGNCQEICNGFCTIRKLASVSRITLFLFKILPQGAPI